MQIALKSLVSISLAFATICFAQPTPSLGSETVDLPGARPDGSVRLPNQWSLRPVGRQVLLGDFPVNIALHPQNRFAAVLHCGYGQHEIIVVDLRSGKVASRITLEEAFYGITFSRDGRTLFCSGAATETVNAFRFENGFLANPQAIPLRDATERGIPAGLAVSSDSRKLYVAELLGHRVSEVDMASRSNRFEILLSAPAPSAVPSGAKPADDADTAAITKRAEALLDPTQAEDAFPYACVLDEKRDRLYVSLWAQAAVAVIDLKSKRVVARWAAEEHPNEMLLSQSGKHLFVANANRNTVTVFETETGRAVETLIAALYPNSLPGSTPNSLALSPDEKLLFVANANINALAVFDVGEPGKSRSLGFIPVGWYPTSVRVTGDGKKLLVANGKGIISKPNRHGPQPGREAPSTVREYIGGLFQGTLSIIELPGRERFEEQLKKYTELTYRCSPLLADGKAPLRHEPGHPIPLQPGDPTPIKYCIYIIKENRTYDQVLGDLPQGNGDAALCLFGEEVTPNHHKLAREFVLLDNFYVESEVSADGHEWSMGAYASDFVEKMWPLSYGHGQSKKYTYPSEGRFKIAEPAGGYLWDRAREAGVSYRSYGEFVNNAPTSAEPCTSRVAALEGHFDPWFRSFDMDYPDVKRAERFMAELKRFESEGEMPRLQIVRLPNDHTSGTAAGKLTPTAQVADNDLAFGRVVEAVSRSKFWPQTAIFVVEDDAQNGPDHIDAHRTIAFAISPYIKRGTVDSTLYSTSSMLRTMELILGLKPMSQFDAAAMPMFNSFQAKPDLKPYQTVPVTVDLEERNLASAYGSELSAKMDFSKEDAADDLLLNEVVWRSVRGADHPMPPPTRAAFVFIHSGDEDED
ncbi:MAG: alkaline phosphatase family protein [Verrucomicrobiota bacterium]